MKQHQDPEIKRTSYTILFYAKTAISKNRNCSIGQGSSQKKIAQKEGHNLLAINHNSQSDLLPWGLYRKQFPFATNGPSTNENRLKLNLKNFYIPLLVQHRIA